MNGIMTCDFCGKDKPVSMANEHCCYECADGDECY